MKQNNSIRKCLAVFMLVLFAISAVPKAYFHDLIADHKDVSFCSDYDKAPCAHKQGYNCHFDDLVVQHPYLVTETTGITITRSFSIIDVFHFKTSFCQAFFFHAESRGPPSV